MLRVDVATMAKPKTLKRTEDKKAASGWIIDSTRVTRKKKHFNDKGHSWLWVQLFSQNFWFGPLQCLGSDCFFVQLPSSFNQLINQVINQFIVTRYTAMPILEKILYMWRHLPVGSKFLTYKTTGDLCDDVAPEEGAMNHPHCLRVPCELCSLEKGKYMT